MMTRWDQALRRAMPNSWQPPGRVTRPDSGSSWSGIVRDARSRPQHPGWGPDAEDAVQDATLVGLSRLGDLRDPSAAGPWLRAITRNAALMMRRSTGRETTLDPTYDPPSRDLTPEQALENHALRDWVWTAVANLSEPLRVTLVLRYFTSASSYEQIAAACEMCPLEPCGAGSTRHAPSSTSPSEPPRRRAHRGRRAHSPPQTRRRRAPLLSAERPFHARWPPPAPLTCYSSAPRASRRVDATSCPSSWIRPSGRSPSHLNQVFAGGRVTVLEAELLNPRGTHSTARQQCSG